MNKRFDIILIAVIAATPPTIVATASLIKATQTHDLVNSRMTELLEITKAEATSKATLAEKLAERQREDHKGKKHD